MDRGLEVIGKSIEIDNKCNFARETMGTIEVQRGDVEKGINMFNKAINLAKSDMDMAYLQSPCDAAHPRQKLQRNMD